MSRGPVNAEGVLNVMSGTANNVTILGGTHGIEYRLGDRELTFGTFGHEVDSMCNGELMSHYDQRVYLRDNPNPNNEVRVLDVKRMSSFELRQVMTSGDDVIVGVCHGALNASICNAFDQVTGRRTNGQHRDRW